MVSGDERRGFGTGGMMLLYGVMIGQALRAKSVSVQELTILRDQVQATVDAQGNLVEALAELNSEIARRGGAAAATPRGAPKAADASRRFLVDVSGLAIPDGVMARIELRLRDAVIEELASVDNGGDLVATPLSETRTWGGGLGGALAGMFIRPR